MNAPTAEPDEVPPSTADVAAHAEHEHIAAIFADREHAADAIDSLHAVGVDTDHLGLALKSDRSILFEHDEETEMFRDTATGAAVGAPIGAIAGIALASLVVPGVGLIGLGGMLAFAGASALWGGMVGGYLGAAPGLDGWTAHADIRYTALEPNEVLVVVCSHGRADDIRRIMQRHEGRLHHVAQTEIGRWETRDRTTDHEH
jgi:hypothetical protein